MAENRNFKGVWIPAALWLDPDLSILEKALLAEIDSLYDHKKGGCFASNAYFGSFFKLSKSRISEVISKLRAKKYLFVTLTKERREGQIYARRIMKLTNKGGSGSRRGVRESQNTRSENQIPHSGNSECINTVNNTDNIPSVCDYNKTMEKVKPGHPLYQFAKKLQEKKEKREASGGI